MTTKKELAEQIVSEFPDRGHDEKKLIKDNTHDQLTDLLSSLRAEDSETSSQADEQEQDQDEPTDAASEADTANNEPDAAHDTANNAEKDLYQLADSSKHYHSRAFNLKGEEQKPLPKNPDGELLIRIRAGYIVKVGD